MVWLYREELYLSDFKINWIVRFYGINFKDKGVVKKF